MLMDFWVDSNSTKKVAVNMFKPLHRHLFSFHFGKYLKVEWLIGKCLIISNCFPKWLYFYILSTVYESFSCSTSPPALDIVRLLNFSHSNGCIKLHCSFNFHFPDEWWCWIPFHVLTGYLNVIFSEMLVHIFHLLLKVGCLDIDL